MQRSLKAEDGGYVSSDEEEEATKGIQRMNVDDLGVIDLTHDDGAAGQNDLTSFQPVRLKREAHKERTLGLNADGATNDEGLTRVASNDAPSADKRKGKARAKDVEITGASETFHGTYSSSDEAPGGEPAIKPEPHDEDSAVPAGLPEPPSPETRRKVQAKKSRTQSGSKREEEKPVLQTQEEVEEWERVQTDLRVLYEELGTQPTVAHPAADAELGGDGPVDQKADKVYLFQFPPVLPELMPVVVKPDPDDAAARPARAGDPMHVDHEPAPTSVAAKARPGNKPPLTVGEGPARLRLPSGCVGKLRIRRSGKAELDWGGTRMSVGMGGEVSFLQDVVVVDVPEKKKNTREKTAMNEGEGGEGGGGGDADAEEEDKGWAMSMGQVKGKFVVTPDWGGILG